MTRSRIARVEEKRGELNTKLDYFALKLNISAGCV